MLDLIDLASKDDGICNCGGGDTLNLSQFRSNRRLAK